MFSAALTICLKTLESLVLEKDLSGTQRGINPSDELALARCSLAIIAFSSFYVTHKDQMSLVAAVLYYVYSGIQKSETTSNPTIFMTNYGIVNSGTDSWNLLNIYVN